MGNMRSAKSVRPMTTFAHSDDTQPDIVDFSRAVQGNISNPRTNLKNHNRDKLKRAAGGTDNLVKAMFGMDNAKMCKVVADTTGTRDGVPYIPNFTARDYKPHTDRTYVPGSRRSDSTFTSTKSGDVGHVTYVPQTNVTEHNLETLLKRADRLDMTLVEYCDFAGISL